MAKEKFRDLEVGERIKEIRERVLGWTREQLGEALRDSPNLTGKRYTYDAIRRWEEDGRVPDAIIIREIAKIAKTTTDQILGSESEFARKCRYEPLFFDLKALIRKYEGDQPEEEIEESARIVEELATAIEHAATEHGRSSATSIEEIEPDTEARAKKGTHKHPRSGGDRDY